MPETNPPGTITTNPSKPTPGMPSGPLPNPVAPGPLPVPDYWKYKPLPPGWNSDSNVALIMASQKVVLDRLKQLDQQSAGIEQERVFLHAWLLQSNTTGHS